MKLNTLEDIAKLKDISLSDLKNLQRLDLSNNQLREIPASFSELKNLQRLDLDNNQLREIPASFSELKNLQELFLHNNKLTELPASFSDLKNLQVLYLHNNKLTELPASFSDLKNLQVLYLHNNKLSELPVSFSDLKNLQGLYLPNNKLSEKSERILLDLMYKNKVEVNYFYKYSCQIRDNETIQLGCFARKISEWEADFFNNPDEFPAGTEALAKRIRAYELMKQTIKRHNPELDIPLCTIKMEDA